MDPRVEETLRRIERLEHTWEKTLTPEQAAAHSYGRVSEDGITIKFWSVPRTTGDFLNALVRVTKAKSVLELGASAGYSTIWLAEAAAKNNGRVYTTELHPIKAKIARENILASGLSQHVILYEQDISDVLRGWSHESIDFAFMDADKEKYAEYYETLLPLITPGGIIVADNAENYSHLMRPFLERVQNDARVASHLFRFDNGLQYVRKN